MSDRIDLESRAAGVVFEAAYSQIGENLDLDELRNVARDTAWEAADNACIYYHHCQTIIQDYERDVDERDVADAIAGQTYEASDWQKAMQAYAFGIAYQVIGNFVEDHLAQLEAVADELSFRACDFVGSGEVGKDDLTVSRDCPYGWSAHDSEDTDGTCLWISGQLDGLCAVARKTDSGLWLSYAWEPNALTQTKQETNGTP